MTVAAFGLEQPLTTRPSAESLIAAVCVGIFSTGPAYAVLYYLIAHAGPVFTSTFGYIVPVFTILVSRSMLGEDLGLSHMAGIVITLAGAWLVNRKPEKIAPGAR